MNQPVLTEKELEYIFAKKKMPKQKGLFSSTLVFLLSFAIISGIVYLIINVQSISANLSYWYQHEYKNDQAEIDAISLGLPESTDQPNSNKLNSNNVNFPDISDNSLSIPVIGIKAPITWKVQNNPNDVAANLAKGLIQIDGTSLPGQSGNVFITGHSSNYPWAKGNYNHVFALLNKVVVGDKIQIKYQNQDFIYQVKEIQVVNPDDTSVMAQTSGSRLTLMTCTPVGTSLRRLIVISEQIYPAPNKNSQNSSPSSNTQALPSIR